MAKGRNKRKARTALEEILATVRAETASGDGDANIENAAPATLEEPQEQEQEQKEQEQKQHTEERRAQSIRALAAAGDGYEVRGRHPPRPTSKLNS